MLIPLHLAKYLVMYFSLLRIMVFCVLKQTQPLISSNPLTGTTQLPC